MSFAHLFECDSFQGNQLISPSKVCWLDGKMSLYEPVWMCRGFHMHSSYETLIDFRFYVFRLKKILVFLLPNLKKRH